MTIATLIPAMLTGEGEKRRFAGKGSGDDFDPVAPWKWSDQRLGTGEPMIDGHHKYLFSIILELRQHHASGKGAGRLPDILSRLHSYAMFHFTAEERMVRCKGCPRLASHKNDHHEFLAMIDGYSREYGEGTAGSRNLAEELTGFLVNWLENHIMCFDVVCFRCGKESGCQCGH